MLLDWRFAPFGLIVCLQLVTSACSSRVTTNGVSVSPETAASRRPEPASDCSLIAEPGDPVAIVGVGERINPANAPRPANESERLLFRQLYETLVRVDCNGQVGPGLAASWRLDADGRAWIVSLRENARFDDGTPVTAADVRASWTRDGLSTELRPDVSRLVQSAVPVNERDLAITLRASPVDAPLALAQTDLAVARPAADSPWPLGTRSSRVASPPAGDALPPVIVLDREGLSSVRFLVARADPRDLLDEGVDLLLTRDAAALEYAATLSQFQSAPLAWHRTHVLLIPGRSSTSPALSDEARQALADDAVRGEARGARGPFWWEEQPSCEFARSPLRGESSLTSEIVYDADDAAARDLAERLVALAGASDLATAAFRDALLPDRPRRTYRRATGLTGDALARARRRGNHAGYIMAVESRPLDPCRELQVLAEGAPWLDPETIVPLVDTRLHAIVRRGRSAVTAEWDGGLLLAPGTVAEKR